jgi:hypothetical protein
LLGAFKCTMQSLLGASDPEGLRSLLGTLDLIVADVPWELIPGVPHDIYIPDGDVPDIIKWMIAFLCPHGKIAIGLGPEPLKQAVWYER